jgi:hypothetical protein
MPKTFVLLNPSPGHEEAVVKEGNVRERDLDARL